MKIQEYIRLAMTNKTDPFFIKYLKGKKVLDVGSGRGEFLARDPSNFIGIDVDPILINICKLNGLNARLMNAKELNFPDESFDAVHASQLIEHLNPIDASAFLKETSRIIKKNGIVYLTTPGVKNIWNTFSHIRPYPPSAFKKLLSNNTENYICENKIQLVFEGAWGHRSYYKNRLLMFILIIRDLIWKPSNPIGWTIILRKPLTADF